MLEYLSPRSGELNTVRRATQQTQNIVQCLTNVEDVGSTLYKMLYKCFVLAGNKISIVMARPANIIIFIRTSYVMFNDSQSVNLLDNTC